MGQKCHFSLFLLSLQTETNLRNKKNKIWLAANGMRLSVTILFDTAVYAENALNPFVDESFCLLLPVYNSDSIMI